jgi:uncharacterized membrane protein
MMYGPTTDYNPGGGNVPNPYARVRFEAIGEAWSMVRAQMGTWVLIMLVYFVIIFGVSFAMGFVLALVGLAARHGAAGEAVSTGANLLGQAITNVVSVCVGAYFMAGIFRAALKQLRGGTIEIGDLFTGGDVTLPMIGGTLLSQIVTIIGMFLLIIPGIIASGGLAFTIPLIADKRAGAIDALKLSWAALKGQAFAMFGFLFVSSFLCALGIFGCGVGLLVTAPIYYISIAIVYNDFFGAMAEPEPRIDMPLPPQSFPTTPGSLDV